MAGGFAKDGAVQDQIDATIEDSVARVRGQLLHGESITNCEERSDLDAERWTS